MAPRPYYSKTVVWASLLLLAQELVTVGQSVGWLTYQTTAGVGKEKYTFACDPQFGPGTGIEGRTKADAQFYAELWWSPATNVNPGQLRPVPGSLVSYRDGSTAGLYRIESSPNLLDWNQEALVRTLSAPFQVYPVWRGHEARRFFRSVVLE